MHARALTLLLIAGLFAGPAYADDEAEERILELIEESVASQRRRGLDRTGTPETDEHRQAMRTVYRALEGRRVTVNFDQTPFKDAMNCLRDISGLNIVVSKRARDRLTDEDVELTLRLRDIKLRNCFELMLKQADPKLRYGIRHGVLFVALDEEWKRDTMILQLLDVGDLIHQPPDFPGPRMGIDQNGVTVD